MSLDQQLDMAEDLRLAGRYDEAKVQYEALVFEENKVNVNYTHALRGLAEVHRMLENFTESETHYQQAIERYNEINHSKGLGYAYLGLGQLNRHQNNKETAKENIQKAIEYFSESEDQYGSADANIELGHLYLSEFNYKTAKGKFFRNAL